MSQNKVRKQLKLRKGKENERDTQPNNLFHFQQSCVPLVIKKTNIFDTLVLYKLSNGCAVKSCQNIQTFFFTLALID